MKIKKYKNSGEVDYTKPIKFTKPSIELENDGTKVATLSYSEPMKPDPNTSIVDLNGNGYWVDEKGIVHKPVELNPGLINVYPEFDILIGIRGLINDWKLLFPKKVKPQIGRGKINSGLTVDNFHIDPTDVQLPSYAKPNYQGDHLVLTKERLNNGGLERLGKTIDEGTPEQIKQWENINNTGELSGLSRDFYKNKSVIDEDILELPSNQVNLVLSTNISPDNVGAALPQQTYFKFTDSDVPDPLNIYASHEYNHFIHTPLKGENFLVENTPDIIKNYFTSTNNAELSSRFTQLKNYFGLKEGLPITKEMWNYAKTNYVKDTGIDNNMTEFFKYIDLDKLNEFLKWGYKNSAALLSPILVNKMINSTEKKQTGGIINYLNLFKK